jgi:DNA polymerase
MLILDFETRSRVDLKSAGTYLYASDPSTEIICLAIIDQDSKETWLWYADSPWAPAKSSFEAIERAELIGAHNAEFDMGIYEYIAVELGWPEIPFEKWYCTMAQCRVNALPAALDDAAWALGLTTRKHASGKDLIQKLSIPNKDTGEFNRNPALIKEMGAYCMQDVKVTDAIVKGCRQMSAQEHRDWLINTQINERGVKIDHELATLSLQYAGAEQAEIGDIMSEITNGTITKHTQNLRIKTWLTEQLPASHGLWEYTRVFKKGVEKVSLDKDIRRTILLAEAGGYLVLPADVAEMLELLDDGSKSSVAKFKRMLQRADPEDGRVRGAYVFAGASQTLRYASRGLQMHNMRRDCWSADETERLKDYMRMGTDLLHFKTDDHPDSNVMEVLSMAIRPAIVPEEGKVFVVGDWSSIEARCLHYATDTQEGDDKLDLFEKTSADDYEGPDTYEMTAAKMGYDDRQLGKTAELACGYQGGHRAFQAMAKNFGFSMHDDEAGEVVDRWRTANWWVVNYWDQLNEAAKNAVAHPGKEFSAGIVKYVYLPKFIEGTLICLMPGGNAIQYPKAKLEQVKTPWGATVWSITSLKASFKPKSDAKAWPRVALYGGILCENICQAFSAAILRWALREASEDCIGHTHDEIIWEVPEALADDAVIALRSVMNLGPDWAEGLPLKTEPKIMHRYGK